LNDEINTVSKKISLLPQEDEMARLLMTVPGIGYYSVLCYVNYWRLMCMFISPWRTTVMD